MRKRTNIWARVSGALILTAFLVLGCSDSPGPSSADGLDVSGAIALEGGSTLVFQDNGQLNAQRASVEQIVKESLAAVRRLMPMDGITILITAGSSGAIPELGIGGRADGGTVRMVLNPNSPMMVQSLEDGELFSMLAHEMHHVARSRTVGYGPTLSEAMVSEGLADQFSMEVAGVDPPLWSVALSADELAVWSARAREEWFNPSYNHDAWFFGTAPPIPRWAGYSIGFQLTTSFLQANPSRRPSELFAEPASSFLPP